MYSSVEDLLLNMSHTMRDELEMELMGTLEDPCTQRTSQGTSCVHCMFLMSQALRAKP